MRKPVFRIINGPNAMAKAMILRRLPIDVKKEIEDKTFASIALVDANVPSVFYYADIAAKSGDVFTAEMRGTCPDHITTLAIFGDISAVAIAVKAICNAEEQANS